METHLLLEKIKQGDKESFKRLFYHYYPRLVAYAQSYLYDKGKSEDIVQDVFLYLWEHAAEMEVKISVQAYLYKMTRNRCLNVLRSLRLTDSFYTLDVLAQLDKPVYESKTAEGPPAQYVKVLQIMDSFPEGMREIFKLRYFENYSYKEIASILNLSLNTVKTQLKRAKARLIEKL